MINPTTFMFELCLKRPKEESILIQVGLWKMREDGRRVVLSPKSSKNPTTTPASYEVSDFILIVAPAETFRMLPLVMLQDLRGGYAKRINSH